MNKFSDFNFEFHDFYICPQISIDDVLNEEIVVLDCQQGIKTAHGENRCILHIQRADGTDAKIFSNAMFIKAAVARMTKDSYPFSTVIKCIKAGGRKMYRFT